MGIGFWSFVCIALLVSLLWIRVRTDQSVGEIVVDLVTFVILPRAAVVGLFFLVVQSFSLR